MSANSVRRNSAEVRFFFFFGGQRSYIGGTNQHAWFHRCGGGGGGGGYIHGVKNALQIRRYYDGDSTAEDHRVP